MKNIKLVLILLVICGLSLFSKAEAQSQPSSITKTATGKTDGAIISQTPYPFPVYETLSDSFKRLYLKEEFERAKNNSDWECLRIEYASDGLRVVGFIIKPKTAAKKLPVIIFNRGGFQDESKINLNTLLNLYKLAYEGFVVVASQYRGNDGGEGKDELGGADVRDTLNLLPLAKSLNYVDTNNVFLYGMSRGGMQSFLALKQGLTVNAVAVVGPLTDAESLVRRVPLFAMLGKQILPDFDTRRDEVLRERSAIRWAEKINAPVLLMHGGADKEIPPGETLLLAQRLQELGKPYQITVFYDGDHLLSKYREERDRNVINWFKRYMNPKIQAAH